MWAKIITIKRTKDLKYFSLFALNLFNTQVSQFELNYWNKWTFPQHSNLLRCTCVCIYNIYLLILSLFNLSIGLLILLCPCHFLDKTISHFNISLILVILCAFVTICFFNTIILIWVYLVILLSASVLLFVLVEFYYSVVFLWILSLYYIILF